LLATQPSPRLVDFLGNPTVWPQAPACALDGWRNPALIGATTFNSQRPALRKVYDIFSCFGVLFVVPTHQVHHVWGNLTQTSIAEQHLPTTKNM
jgi:hypothetical protein